jgi:hypothetical protein
MDAFNINPWIGRIAEDVEAIKYRVYGAAELEVAIQQGQPRLMPAMYLVPSSERAAPNHLSTGLSQRVEVRFSVVTAIRNVADAVGGPSHEALRLLRIKTRAAIVGWSPNDELYDPTEFAQGQLLRFINGVLWWEDVYTTAYHLREL